MMDSNWIIRLLVIEHACEFAEAAVGYVNALEQRYGPLVMGRKAGLIPKRGDLSGVPFLFHGSGLRFEREDSDVDFDFSDDFHGLVVDWFKLKRFGRRLAIEGAKAGYIDCLVPPSPLPEVVDGRRFYWRP